MRRSPPSTPGRPTSRGRGHRVWEWFDPRPRSVSLRRGVCMCDGSENPGRRPSNEGGEMLLNRAKDSVDILIVVRDIEKSLGFYQRTLGLEKTEELQTPFGVSHRLRYGTSLVKLLDPKEVPPAGPI